MSRAKVLLRPAPSEGLPRPVAQTADVLRSVPHAPFDAARTAFDRAVRARPDTFHERVYRFGGRPVRLRVVGRELARHVARPFAQLAADIGNTAPDLVIDLWDEAETGAPHPRDAAEAPGDRAWRVAGGWLTAFDGGRILRYRHPHAMTWLDRRAGHMIGWRASAIGLPIHERSKPFPLLLPIWYYDRGIHVVHAGLVATRGDGLLVGGGSGTGKTTTALAALVAGLDYLGDDQSGLEARPDGSLVGHSLYNGARVAADHLERFPTLRPHAVSRPETSDKELLFLAEIRSDRCPPCAAIRAIGLPTVDGAARTRIRRARKGEALRRLAPTSVFTPFGPGAHGFRQLSRLVEAVPSYWLELGPDPEDVGRAVARILAGEGA